MDTHKSNIFEQHPKKTLSIVVLALIAAIYGLCSLKIINNSYTQNESRSIKKVVHQYYAGKIIDNNVGRFIKLRENYPSTERFDRPSRNYMKNVAANTIERKYYRIQTDANGFIEPSEIHANPDHKIVFLGGSTTEGFYNNELQRFPYLVGRKLEKITNKKINTYNGGVSANESRHSINILLNKVIAMQPDIVVLMHNINDLSILRSQGSYDYTDSLKSHLQTSKNVFSKYEYPPANIQFDAERIKLQFRQNLELFVSICNIYKITPVLMTQANRIEQDDLYHQFNEIIRQVASQQQTKLIDLAVSIPKKTEYIYDTCHFTDLGSEQVAEIITGEIVAIM